MYSSDVYSELFGCSECFLTDVTRRWWLLLRTLVLISQVSIQVHFQEIPFVAEMAQELLAALMKLLSVLSQLILVVE